MAADAAARDMLSGSVPTSATASRPPAPSIATAAAASDIFGRPAAVPARATAAAASDTFSQSAASADPSAQPQPLGNAGNGGSVANPGPTSVPAAAQAASKGESSPKSDINSSIAQIQAEPEVEDISADDVQQRSAQPAAYNSGPFADATADSSLPFGEESSFQAHDFPFGGSQSGQHAFDSSQNGFPGLATAGDSGSSFFAAQSGDALANGADPDSFFDDLSGTVSCTCGSCCLCQTSRLSSDAYSQAIQY